MADPKSTKPTILLQLDTDPHPSVFDAVVALDSGVDQLLSYGSVRPDQVRDLVHGLLFTRGGTDIRRSAIFIGGSDFAAAEQLSHQAQAAFFGPFEVSVLLDARGANTTAAAAVRAIEQSRGQESSWDRVEVAVLGNGPVGGRTANLLACLGAFVHTISPDFETTEPFQFHGQSGQCRRTSLQPGASWPELLAEAEIVVAAGPAGVEILASLSRAEFPALRVAVDLNAVPPHGLGSIKPTDADADRDGVRSWGALGVGGLKMKLHKAAIRALFDDEPGVFDIREVYEVGRRVLQPPP